MITLSANLIFTGLARARAWEVVHIDYQVAEQMYYNPAQQTLFVVKKDIASPLCNGDNLLRTVCSTSCNPMLRQDLHDFLTRMTAPVQMSAKASAEAAGFCS